jgi:homoaconitate hydratase family protein
MGKTFVEKLLAWKSGRESVAAGDTVVVEPDLVLTHENTAAIRRVFESIEPGIRVRYPERHVIVLDHCTPAATEKHAANHRAIREFVRDQGLPHFHDVGEGICHQVLVERHARPGQLIVGSDSHTVTAGALGALAVPIDRTEAAGLFAEGRLWLLVPRTIRVELSGAFRPGVTAKDLILRFIGDVGAAGADYRCVEFGGPAVGKLSMDERLTVANMIIEAGAKCAYFPPDETTRAFVRAHAGGEWREFFPDPDAEYERVIPYDLGELEPVAAAPHKVDNCRSVRELQHVELDQVLIGACTNGRASDLRAAAEILAGGRVHPRVRLLLLPASRAVLLEAIAQGWIQAMVAAGATLINPGCGPCMGNHQGILAPGEVCLSTANRNFRGRMGCKEAEIYLASPITAACSALTGRITDFATWRRNHA